MSNYSRSHWRNIAAPIIAEVIERVGRENEKALKTALREAYPWGQRKYHPYKIWCSEIRIQLGKPKSKKERCKSNDCEDQMEMF